jgi:threonine aldolase
MITTERGVLTAEQIESSVRPPNVHHPITKIVTIENTHNRHGGTIFPLDEIKQIRKVADNYDLLMHLDGARIWNASVATGIALSDWATPFDSISACLSKGLGAPVGSMIIGSREFIGKARRIRKLFGGGMRQVGILAAAGLYALEHNIERLADDHRNARLLAEGLANIKGFECDLSRVETNIVIVDIAKTGRTPDEIVAILKDKGILAVVFGKTRLRFVTHLDVSRDECLRALEIISRIRLN